MKLENSPFLKNCLIKFSEPFGEFYLFEKFIVSEINEGVHFDWEKAEILINRVHEYFGTTEVEINYLSNRVHSYSVTAQDWLKFYQERHTVDRVAIVAYEKKGFLSVQLEKMFTKSNYKTFNSLEEAVEWLS
ncbi:MAG: hypothetical protein CMC70_05300 [Flavobacteriaceae bacterium]|nr:hypothetical protein [Flavobacteriaceae bacterium]